MATNREIEELYIRIEGAREVKKLEKDIADNEEQIEKWRKKVDQGTWTMEKFRKVSFATTVDLIDQKKKLADLEKQGRDAAGGVRELAYGLQDAATQGGDATRTFLALSNNLQMMAEKAGLSEKNLLMVTAAIVAAQVVIENWEPIKEFFTFEESDFKKSVEGMKEQLADLSKKKVKVGVDFMDIEALENKIHAIETAIQNVNDLQKQQTEAGKATAKSFEDAFVDAVDAAGNRISGGDIKAQMISALIPEASQLSDTLTQSLAEADKEIAKWEAKLKEIETLPVPEAIKEGMRIVPRMSIEQSKEAKRTALAEVTRPGGLAEQLLGTKMEEAKHGTEAQQKAATEFLAKRAAKTPEVQARIAELPALGQVESAQARARKEIKTAQELQAEHIKEAMDAEARGATETAKQHWAAAEEEGRNADKIMIALDKETSTYQKNKKLLTDRSRRLRQIEEDQIRETTRQMTEKPAQAQEQIQKERQGRLRADHDKEQKRLMGEVAAEADFQRRVSLIRRDAESKKLEGQELIDYVQQAVYELLKEKIKEKAPGRGMEAGAAVFEQATAIAEPSAEKMRAENLRFAKEKQARQSAKDKEADRQRKETLKQGEAAVGQEEFADIRSKLGEAQRMTPGTKARAVAMAELRQQLSQALAAAARENRINAQDIPNMFRMIQNAMIAQTDETLRNVRAGVMREIQNQRDQAKREGRAFIEPRPMEVEQRIQQEAVQQLARPGEGPGPPVRQPLEPIPAGIGPAPLAPAFKSVAPEAPAPPPGGGGERVAAAAERGNAITGQMQGAMGDMLARMAQIESNQQLLAQQAGMLQRAASEHQVSALPFGFGTA